MKDVPLAGCSIILCFHLPSDKGGQSPFDGGSGGLHTRTAQAKSEKAKQDQRFPRHRTDVEPLSRPTSRPQTQLSSKAEAAGPAAVGGFVVPPDHLLLFALAFAIAFLEAHLQFSPTSSNTSLSPYAPSGFTERLTHGR